MIVVLLGDADVHIMGVVVVQLLVTYIKLPVVVEGGPRQTALPVNKHVIPATLVVGFKK